VRPRRVPSIRMRSIEPFYAMDILARARDLEAKGRSVVHMEVGEPDFPTAAPIVDAGKRALDLGLTHYTPALGLPALREAIAAFYSERYGAPLSPSRIVVTPGASGALLAVVSVLLDPGDQVLMADPGYPCNRNFVQLIGAQPLAVPLTHASAYQLTLDHVKRYWTRESRAVLIASPSNPTGTLMPRAELEAIVRWVEDCGGVVIMDEIYHGLVYQGRAETVLGLSDDAFVINSFSKYFGMTGWRVGWLVAPEPYVRAVDKLVQNIFLAASTPAQHAALAAFTPETSAILEVRREEFRRRRDFLVPALRDLGFRIPATPEGAFYVYADCSAFTQDSYGFSMDLLESVGVAVTPGLDFGQNAPERHVRFAYTTSFARLEEGVRRLADYLQRL
jgi:aspartate/methionine/tyrosine aminotransferase